jgi:hypothetical protein
MVEVGRQRDTPATQACRFWVADARFSARLFGVSKFALGIEAFLARTSFAAARHCSAALAADNVFARLIPQPRRKSG